MHRRTANEAIVDLFMQATDAEAEALLATAKAILKQRRPKPAKRAPRAKPVEVLKPTGAATLGAPTPAAQKEG